MTEIKRTYYESGELCQEYFEEDGKKEGIYKSYYQSGNIKEIVPYVLCVIQKGTFPF
jgi:antitoxin component YwqK of YwqJK toxin-antitoxin module